MAQALDGAKLYQQRARLALPLLVRQARGNAPIFYSDLAAELRMPNPRNLNYVLGSIGRALEALSESWGQRIPAIQCLVINKNSHLPGEGVGWFLEKKTEFKELPRKKQRLLIEGELKNIFAYPHWLSVLESFGLKPAPLNLSTIVTAAAHSRRGGESPQHKRLKEFVSRHPEAIGLSRRLRQGSTEFPLPSGDTLDVLFEDGMDLIGIEVKSSVSNEGDIVRGIFQCVKYQAVLEALQASQDKAQSVRVILVLETSLPQTLIPLKNLLGIEIMELVLTASN